MSNRKKAKMLSMHWKLMYKWTKRAFGTRKELEYAVRLDKNTTKINRLLFNE